MRCGLGFLAVADLNSQDKKATSGSEWYNLPRTILTPELKRDLQLLKMRSVLDPKRTFLTSIFFGPIYTLEDEVLLRSRGVV